MDAFSCGGFEAPRPFLNPSMEKMLKMLQDKRLGEYDAVAIVISAHGDAEGNLSDKEKNVSINTDAIYEALENNDSLIEKPKIVVVDACR